LATGFSAETPLAAGTAALELSSCDNAGQRVDWNIATTDATKPTLVYSTVPTPTKNKCMGVLARAGAEGANVTMLSCDAAGVGWMVNDYESRLHWGTNTTLCLTVMNPIAAAGVHLGLTPCDGGGKDGPQAFGPNPDSQRPIYVLQNIPITPLLRHTGPNPNSRPFGGLCVST
jgi:hypothetical protein